MKHVINVQIVVDSANSREGVIYGLKVELSKAYDFEPTIGAEIDLVTIEGQLV